MAHNSQSENFHDKTGIDIIGRFEDFNTLSVILANINSCFLLETVLV